jgi:hypothetical protein
VPTLVPPPEDAPLPDAALAPPPSLQSATCATAPTAENIEMLAEEAGLTKMHLIYALAAVLAFSGCFYAKRRLFMGSEGL